MDAQKHQNTDKQKERKLLKLKNFMILTAV